MPKYKAENQANQTAEAILNWVEIQKENLSTISELLPAVRDLNLPMSFRKVLLVKYMPGSDALPVSRKAELVGITPRQWYNIIHDKRFLDAAIKFVKDNMGKDVGEVWNAYLMDAKLGNYIAADKILTELGVFQRQKAGETNITVNVAVVEETRIKNLEAGLNRFRFTTAGNKDGD
jgi:hypothetical protein